VSAAFADGILSDVCVTAKCCLNTPGCMMPPAQLNKQGFEYQFGRTTSATSHCGLLIDTVCPNARPPVVTVSYGPEKAWQRSISTT